MSRRISAERERLKKLMSGLPVVGVVPGGGTEARLADAMEEDETEGVMPLVSGTEGLTRSLLPSSMKVRAESQKPD